MAPEDYTFTLTQGDGSRVQGFCRRFLPPAPRAGSKLRHAQVLCIMCEASWGAFFFKVQEVMEQLLLQGDLLLDMTCTQLPPSCPAAQFLDTLGQALAAQPAMGSVISLPIPEVTHPVSVSPPVRVCSSGGGASKLACTPELLQLQIPLDCGNGRLNAGVSLARLLWHVPAPAMVTLIASLLRERRVILVGQSRDTVSAAVAAAAALLHPFKWHHIYLPLLPRSFKEYLTAPMPFLIGLPAQLLPALRGIPMDEVTMIDLDLGTCEPGPGSRLDDAQSLPWRESLEAALAAAYGLMRSPTEHESNPLITSIMHGWYLKLLGNYRSFIYDDLAFLTATGGGSGGTRSGSSSPTPGRAAGRGGDAQDDALKGSGLYFHHRGLVESHRRNERARAFLGAFRQSQMYEQFVQERLAMAAGGGWDDTGDAFELRVTAYCELRSQRLSARLQQGVRSTMTKFQAFVKKHRRGESIDANLARAAQLAREFVAGGAGLSAATLSNASQDAAGPRRASATAATGATPHAPFDPASFFDNDEEEEAEAEAELEASAGRFSRPNSSSNLSGLGSFTAGTRPGSERALARASAPVAMRVPQRSPTLPPPADGATTASPHRAPASPEALIDLASSSESPGSSPERAHLPPMGRTAGQPPRTLPSTPDERPCALTGNGSPLGSATKLKVDRVTPASSRAVVGPSPGLLGVLPLPPQPRHALLRPNAGAATACSVATSHPPPVASVQAPSAGKPTAPASTLPSLPVRDSGPGSELIRAGGSASSGVAAAPVAAGTWDDDPFAVFAAERAVLAASSRGAPAATPSSSCAAGQAAGWHDAAMAGAVEAPPATAPSAAAGVQHPSVLGDGDVLHRWGGVDGPATSISVLTQAMQQQQML